MNKDKTEKYAGMFLSAAAVVCLIRVFALCRGNDGKEMHQGIKYLLIHPGEVSITAFRLLSLI